MSNKEFPAKETNNKEFTADCGHSYRWSVRAAGCMACRCIEAEDELAIYKERDKAQQLVINQLEADIARLRTAAQAVVDRWDSPFWANLPHTSEYIRALRDAIETEA